LKILADEMLHAAVERQFEIVGEAFSGLRRVAPAVATSIPELPRIIAFRNRIDRSGSDDSARSPVPDSLLPIPVACP
jgi:hypothetical protein